MWTQGRYGYDEPSRAMPIAALACMLASFIPRLQSLYALATNGILTVSAQDLDTGKAQSITITANEKMSGAEIKAAIRDAERYAEQDKGRRDALEIQNTAGMALNKAETALRKAVKKLEKEEKKQIKADCADLRKLMMKTKPVKMGTDDLYNIRSAISCLEASSVNACRLAEVATPEDEEPDGDELE